MTYFIYLLIISNLIMSKRNTINKNTTLKDEAQKDPPKNILEKFNNVTGVIVICITLFAAGYTTASIINSIEHKIEVMELKSVHRDELEKANSKKGLTEDEVKLFIEEYSKNKNGKK